MLCGGKHNSLRERVQRTRCCPQPFVHSLFERPFRPVRTWTLTDHTVSHTRCKPCLSRPNRVSNTLRIAMPTPVPMPDILIGLWQAWLAGAARLRPDRYSDQRTESKRQLARNLTWASFNAKLTATVTKKSWSHERGRVRSCFALTSCMELVEARNEIEYGMRGGVLPRD